MFELTIAEIRAQLSAGELTVRGLAQAYLQRIETLDRAGPRLSSIIQLNPDALDDADRLDRQLRDGGARGPLHGVPVLLKDNIDTNDRMMTTAGSLALLGSTPAQDSTVAARLRAAGALILGKTNLSEWANFRSTRSSSGWSSRGGQTRHPYALDRNPCGSSSGSAVAVAADLCAVAVGTETDGSIICPSHICGIVGIKPTLGLVSRAGIIPIAHSQDTAGPMARTVADAAALLAALAGPDPRDPATRSIPSDYPSDYAPYLTGNGLKGLRLGVARSFFGCHPQVDALMEEALSVLRDLGAEIVDPANVPVHKELEDGEHQVLLYEFKADLNAYLGGLGPDAPVHSLADVIAFNEQHREAVMPFFGQELMLQAEAKGPLTDEAYLQALARNHQLARAEGIDATLAEHRLDAIIEPSGGPAWLTDHVNGDHYTGGRSAPAAVAGYPSITVPLGYVAGLPVGLSFVGPAWSEPRLIRCAHAFEQATHVRRPPGFLPTLEV